MSLESGSVTVEEESTVLSPEVEVHELPAVFQEAKEFVRGVPGSGVSVYDHLTQVLVKMLDERPADANALFEEISASVREATIIEPKKPLTEEQLANKTDVGSERSRQAVLSWTRDRAAMMLPPPVEPNFSQIKFPDLMDESQLWAWANVSLGETATYVVQLGLRQLAAAHKLHLRFWGKVHTRSGDYFLAEARTKENPAKSRPERIVMEGTEGPNKYTYYVSKSPGGADTWQALPHVTPRQLVVAQQTRRFFTGDLGATVPSFPPVPPSPGQLKPDGSGPAEVGTEANLLRAVVALITADTVLALNGFLEAEPEEGEDEMGELNVLKPAEAPEPVTFDALKDPGTFVHAELDISPVGRTQATPQPRGPDGEVAEGPEEPDPEPKAALRSIAEDVRELDDQEKQLLADAGVDQKTLWQLKTEQVPVKPTGPPNEDGAGKAESAQSVAVLKSTKWPGAVCVAREGKTCVNVYVGNGVVSAAMRPKPYELALPKAVASEWRDPAMADDPEADPTAGMAEQADVIFEPQVEAEDE
mmetsp:Transcript_35537/g.80173  ORF Transcript_35537/g.80173 Transcript_35537/m.80173 type:complete len:532 (-) Transcript_35537:334-1929(-)